MCTVELRPTAPKGQRDVMDKQKIIFFLYCLGWICQSFGSGFYIQIRLKREPVGTLSHKRFSYVAAIFIANFKGAIHVLYGEFTVGYDL